jgi:DNA-binding NarL/FixJ family response regulator
MYPCHLQEQPDAVHARPMPSIPNAEDAAHGVFARIVNQKPTAARCANCHVSRERDELILKMFGLREAADKRLASLTTRQYDIMQRVLSGQPSKNIAADLQISQRTVENHRSEIMKRTGTRSLPELARLALAADWTNPIA